MAGGRYNVVYYWDGGLDEGEWKAALPRVLDSAETVSELVARIERGGRVAKRGHTNIGAPEGAPSLEDFLRVGFIDRAAYARRKENS